MLPTVNIKKIFKIIEWLLFLILLGILFLVASPLLPTKEYISTHVIMSGSMEPAIKTGSIVFSTLQTDEINRGDVIVFTSPTDTETTIVHRIMEIEDGMYITKGDNNDNEDEWGVPNNSVKGKVFLTIPYVGHAIEWMKTPIGFFVILGIPALIFAVSQIKKIKDGINEEVEKRTKEEVEKHLSKEKTPPILPVILILFGILFSTKISNAYALFSSTVNIEGITISVGYKHTVVINEVMWMGSTISDKDEWIELRNMTNEDIDISNWRLEGAVAGLKGHLQIPHGYSIPANGYFLLANKFENNPGSALLSNVDLRSTSINLDDEYFKNGELILKDKQGNVIDKIDKTEYIQWPDGINEDTKHSMQRHLNPEDGWYSCNIDLCTSETYWNSPDNYGTPGDQNQ